MSIYKLVPENPDLSRFGDKWPPGPA